MAKIYASLIRKGLKTLDQVPSEIRDEVERILLNHQPHNKIFSFKGGEKGLWMKEKSRSCQAVRNTSQRRNVSSPKCGLLDASPSQFCLSPFPIFCLFSTKTLLKPCPHKSFSAFVLLTACLSLAIIYKILFVLIVKTNIHTRITGLTPRRIETHGQCKADN